MTMPGSKASAFPGWVSYVLWVLCALYLTACTPEESRDRPPAPASLQGTWQLDVPATRRDAIRREVLSPADADAFLRDDRVVRWIVGDDSWTLEVNGQTVIDHRGTYSSAVVPGRGSLTGSEIGGRPTLIDIHWIEPGHSFWASSRNHALWPGYREQFKKE